MMSLLLAHPSTKPRFALWTGSICNMIYFYLWYARYTWSTMHAIELEVFYNLEPSFYQMIEAFLAVSTRSIGAVLQPVVSFTVHSFIHFHLPYTLNKTENKSMTNKSASKTRKSELSCMSNFKNTVSDCRGIWLCVFGIILVQCSFIQKQNHTCTIYQRANKAHLRKGGNLGGSGEIFKFSVLWMNSI